MNFRNLISAFICALFLLSHVAIAQERASPSTPVRPGAGGPTTLAAPTGKPEFPACCEACPAGGCTGCNAPADTPGLNCGPGLIKANCQVVNNGATCVREE